MIRTGSCSTPKFTSHLQLIPNSAFFLGCKIRDKNWGEFKSTQRRHCYRILSQSGSSSPASSATAVLNFEKHSRMNMDTDAEMTDVPVDIHPDAPGTGRPGLRPPPGFEHLLPAVARDNDSDSAAGSSYILSQDPSEIGKLQLSSPSPFTTLPTHEHCQFSN